MKIRKAMSALAFGFCSLVVSSVDQASAQEQDHGRAVEYLLAGDFHWTTGQPLLVVDPRNLPATPPDNPWVAIKDPSIVRYQDRWHLFCSLRKRQGGQGRIRIGYLSFADWEDAPAAHWHLLELTEGYHGAPQVFFFTPHKKWYLIYQAVDPSRGIEYGPCFSTTDKIADPSSWTLPMPLYERKPDNVIGWLDFWVVCDESKSHLFFTSLDGRMWRAETNIAEFPRAWSRPSVVLCGDIFEASHTYRLKGLNKFLTLIEARAESRRYFKAYLADRLDGEWRPLAATRDRPFASPVNVRATAAHWTDSFSHGELIRTGVDQTLEVDPAELRFLFQGASEADRAGEGYGAIPWKLGLLDPADGER